MTHAEEHDLFWAKVIRFRTAFHELAFDGQFSRDAAVPLDGIGPIIATYASRFWILKTIDDSEPRELKDLGDLEFELLIVRMQEAEYKAVWYRQERYGNLS